MQEDILDRLNGEYWRGREGTQGASPITVARAQLKASPSGCWPLALQTLKAAYDANTARDAWVALLSEPNSGWSTFDPQSQTWTLYCVPGYQPLCGDSIESCPIGQPAGQPQYVYAPMQAYAPGPMQYVPAAGQAAPTGMTTGEKWTLFFVVAGLIWFVWMSRPESEEEKRHYLAAHRNRRTA